MGSQLVRSLRGLAIAALVVLGLAAPTQATAPPSYAGPHLVYRTANGHVHVLTAPQVWFLPGLLDHDQDATVSSHTTSRAVGTPWGWIDTQQEHVVYRSANGHVHELWRTAGVGSWKHIDLTVAAKTTVRAAGDITGSGLYYRGTDADLHSLRFNATTHRWHDVDLSSAAHTTAKVGADPRYEPDDDSLTYRSTDGHLHLVTIVGSHVTDTDVWKAAHAKVAATGRPTTWEGLGNFVVLYRGADRHVHELVRADGAGTWTSQDLTTTAGTAASVAGDPIFFSWVQDSFIPYLEVRYVSARGALVSLSKGVGGYDPDHGVVDPTPWFGSVQGTGYRSVSPFNEQDSTNSRYGFPSVTIHGHLQLTQLDLTQGTTFPTDVTAEAHAPRAATGVTAYYTPTS